ncbi:MAG TPA: ribonuclease J [Alphaproteobacteria bacterium]|nr:ribonuclease J [Alphaproteobacteria bacterium]
MTDDIAQISAGRNELLFVPLGGAGEIGMNLNLFGHAGQWLMVDLGVTFGDDSAPGIEVVMPDPQFIVERRDRLAGLVLTHAHEDHIGAVPYLWSRLRCPLYATPFTASVLRRKLQEVGLVEAAPITEVPSEGMFTVGPFAIELITLTHSIPEPNALLIRTPAGSVFHTGDWKFDPEPLIGAPADERALRALGDRGILALIGDSTNVFREGESGSEADVRESLIDLVGRCRNRVAIACFASNVARLETVATVAAANNRHAALVGRSLWRMYDAARENGYLTEIKPFLTEEEAGFLPREEVLLAVTGSQGEPRAALARIAAGEHAHIVLEGGDTVVFSSRIIPGNERAIARLHNALVHRGIEVISERDEFVHVSGHPARDELVRMYQLIRPRIAVPVHGEPRHLLEHGKLATECQVPESVVALNGDVVRLAPGRAEIIGTVPSGRLAADGTVLVPIEDQSVHMRRRMMFNGSAVATVVLDAAGELLAPPQVTLQGLADEVEAGELARAVAAAVRSAVEELPRPRRRDDAEVREAARLAVRRAVRTTRGKKPPIDIHVVRLGDRADA